MSDKKSILNPYCTIRRDNEKINQRDRIHFCTLRKDLNCLKSPKPIVLLTEQLVPETSIPYTSLSKSVSSDDDSGGDSAKQSDQFDVLIDSNRERRNFNEEHATNEINSQQFNEADLIDLDEMNDGNIESKHHCEAINTLLLERCSHHDQSINPSQIDLKKLCSINRNSFESLPVNDEFGYDFQPNFKRLETFCTLRFSGKYKQQRCLDLIQTITNSSLIGLNDAIDSHTEQAFASKDTNTEALKILLELDKMLSQQDTSDWYGQENVDDCLLELDNYLDQIDCNSIDISPRESHIPASINNEIELNQQTSTFCIDDEPYQNENNPSDNIFYSSSGTSGICNELIIKEIDVVEDNSSPILNNCIMGECPEEQCTASASIEDFDYSSDVITRSHPLRHTINIFQTNPIANFERNCTRFATLRANNHIKSADNRSSVKSKRKPSWRRHSMRRTERIKIPDNTIVNESLYLTFDDCSTRSPSPLSNLERLNGESNENIFLNSNIDLSNDPSATHISDTSDVSMATSNLIIDTNDRQNSEPVMLSLTDEYLNNLQQGLTADNSELVFDNSINRDTNLLLDYNFLNPPNTVVQLSDSVPVTPRPRQMGRRAEGRSRVVSITAETNSMGSQRIIIGHDNGPSNSLSTEPDPNNQNLRRYIGSEPSSILSSRNPSPVSLISSSESSSAASATPDDTQRSQPQRSTSRDVDLTSSDDSDENDKNKGWPLNISRLLAGTTCTLGLFNISRFSIFSIHYGANFIVQFFILSFIFGVPMLWLQMSLGAKIKRGPIKMWRISPICKGIGISLVLVQAGIALYTAVSIGWVLVYFRDSFVSRYARYRWQEPFDLFRGHNAQANDSMNLVETVPDYFNGVVLQRYQLGPGGTMRVNGMGAVRFQLAFNLAILWIFVFIVLCKGLRFYGKIIIGLTILPLVGLFSICTKMLTMISSYRIQNLFPATDWQDFFINSQSWLSAAQEVFLTWALLGCTIISIFSKASTTKDKRTTLRRDAILIVLLTIIGLLFGAILGNVCVLILYEHRYYYVPGSYENTQSYIFLRPSNELITPRFASYSSKWFERYSTVLGESGRSIGQPQHESGFQALRLVTELFPAALAAATQKEISAIWSIFGSLVFFTFGLAQLCAMWKPIASALGNSASSVLLSCVTGLLLGIPLATESGLTIVYYLDVIFGGSWCILLLWTMQIFAIFLLRGRPFTGDVLVNDLMFSQTLSAFIALSWNLIIPIGLITLSIIQYKLSGSRDFFHWRTTNSYWELWSRKLAGFAQLSVLLLIPVVSIIQIYRYLTNGPQDILERIQLLYRPPIHPQSQRFTATQEQLDNSQTTPSVTIINLESQNIQEDAPPKYTPPPSYTTATGARIAKLFRNSIRRSVRRIIGPQGSNVRQRPILRQQPDSSEQNESLPPAYSTVLFDPAVDDHISRSILQNQRQSTSVILTRSRTNNQSSRSKTLELKTRAKNHPLNRSSTLNTRSTRVLTGREVAQLLRPSTVSMIPSPEIPLSNLSLSQSLSMDPAIVTTTTLASGDLSHNNRTTEINPNGY